jgi:hypothetical protein
MDHRPLTAAQPFEEIVPVDALFPVPSPDGGRPVEVMVLIPEEGDRVVMHIVAAEADAERAVLVAFRAVRKMDGYELTVKPF